MKQPPMPCRVPSVMTLAFLGDGVYSLLDVQKVTIAGVPLVVALLETEDHRILSGSACRLVQEMQSVVHATLDAINRNLEKHLLTI